MDDGIRQSIEKRWKHEHSWQYLSRMAIRKMEMQKRKYGDSLGDIAKDFTELYQ